MSPTIAAEAKTLARLSIVEYSDYVLDHLICRAGAYWSWSPARPWQSLPPYSFQYRHSPLSNGPHILCKKRLFSACQSAFRWLRWLLIFLVILGNGFIASAAEDSEISKADNANLNALPLPPNSLTTEERMQVARSLALAGKLKEAKEILLGLLLEEPGNFRARLQLAKILGQSGDFAASIKEADEVLKISPQNRTAMLVKANALRRRKNLKAAIPLYTQLLETDEEFDTRLGLTYALLSSGNKRRAKESSQLLKPLDASQEEEFEELRTAIDRVTKPNIDLRYDNYSDSDGNLSSRYTSAFTLWLRHGELNAGYKHTEAQDSASSQRADEVFVKTYGKLTESFGIGGGLGLTQVGNDRATNLVAGHIKADATFFNGKVGTRISRDALTSTAQLIENKISMTDLGIYLSQNVTDRLFLHAEYRYKDYSDRNDSDDLRLASRYSIYVKDPQINLGYRFRYLNYTRESHGGYFDPNNFISHQIFGSVYFERGRYYGYVESSIGHQSFWRNNKTTDDLFGTGEGTLGLRPKKDILIELSAEGGNYALGAAAGFNYYVIGTRIYYVF